MFKKISKKQKINISISTRILLFFTVIFITIVLVIILPVTNYYKKTSEQNLKEVGQNTLLSIDDRLHTIISEYKVLSNMTLFQKSFQSDLKNQSDVIKANSISDALLTIVINGTYTSNMLFYHNGKSYFESNLGARYILDTEKLDVASWDKLSHRSFYDIEYNEIFQESFSITYPEDDYITFGRAINSLEDFSFIGLALFNIEKKDLETFLFLDFIRTNFIILDSNSKVILQSSDISDRELELLTGMARETDNFKILDTKSRWSTLSQKQSKFFDWTIVSMTELTNNDIYPHINIILTGLLFVVVIFFLCDLYISINIIKPLSKIKKNMGLVEGNMFIPVTIKQSYFTSEITRLQSFFNKMLLEIESLTNNIKIKEELKRKNELLLLQEQIKPHFLYNTLDSISALNLIGDNDLAYELTTALSGFYRTSLSVANFFVTVEKELECIADYVKILNIRYRNKFNMRFEVEESILQMRIPKLILQPLVENAINHGMRSKEGKGSLIITGKLKQDAIMLTVEDDGIGISPERITEILAGKSFGTGSFGIYNIIEKLTLYGSKDPCQIESKLFEYTKITVKIPREKHGEYFEN